ncbi:MAG TPA: glycosyltransferase family 2 protein [Thermoanaerobaculia bacterium]|nr:glycosyltransferase family 2 protein [Thermoanaerobaculia bacterium]
MDVAARPSDIDIIIVHYHAAALVGEALAALKHDAGRSGLSIHVFVADNGSTDEERALLQSLDLTYLKTGRDAGYAGGINFAFPHTRADCIVIMNEDVMVLPGCLAALRRALTGGAAVVGPEFYWDRDRVFVLPCTEERSRRNEFVKAAGRRSLRALQRARDRWRAQARLHWRCTEPIASTAISGALLAFRRDTWAAVGPWDEGYHLYFDENDWLFRIEGAGLPSLYVPDAKAIHLHNPKLAGDPDRAQWSSESFLRFGKRYYGETFVRRLFRLGNRTPAIPAWEPLPVNEDGATVEIQIPETSAWPVWIELTPSPLGYPAAATRITDASTRRWTLPALAGLPFLTGTLYLQVVDDAGRELGGYAFDRRNALDEPRTVDEECVTA